jgi:hypothetical protein
LGFRAEFSIDTELRQRKTSVDQCLLQLPDGLSARPDLQETLIVEARFQDSIAGKSR